MGSATANGHAGRRSLWRAAFRWLVLPAIGLILCAAVAAALYGREIALGAVRIALAQLGAAPEHIEMRRVGLTGIVLGAIRLPGGLSASEVAVDWTPTSLMDRRLTRVSVTGLTAEIRVEDGKVTIGGLQSGPGGDGAATLPFDELVLADARLEIASGDAHISAKIDARATAAGTGAYGRATLEATATLGGAPTTRIEARLPEWRLSREGGGLQIAVAGASAALPEHALAAAAIDARVTMSDSGSASVNLSADLRDLSTPARFAPLAITAQGQRDGAMLTMSGRIGTGRGVAATFNGRHDLASGQGSLAFDGGPVTFRPDGLQPDDLIPVAGDMLRRVAGTVSARGRLSWRETLAASLTMKLDGVGFESGVARLSGLAATLSLDSLKPPRTPGPQHVAGTLHLPGLPAAPLDLRVRLPGDDRLIVDAATLGLAGGTIRVRDLALSIGGTVRTAIEIRSVDLGAVLALVGVDGLSGTGTIEGQIPVRMDETGVAITSGQLVSTGPGAIRYTGSGLPDGAGGGSGGEGDPVRLLRDALADFHYTSLALTLDRGVQGAGSLLVNLKGANPAVLDNHPFAINIRLEADFDRLAAVLFDGYAAAEGLLRRVKPP